MRTLGLFSLSYRLALFSATGSVCDEQFFHVFTPLRNCLLFRGSFFGKRVRWCFCCCLLLFEPTFCCIFCITNNNCCGSQPYVHRLQAAGVIGYLEIGTARCFRYSWIFPVPLHGPFVNAEEPVFIGRSIYF